MPPPDFQTPVRGPSYSLPMRVLATAIVLVVVVGVLRWWQVPATAGWSSQAGVIFIVTMFGTIGAWILMLRSITEVDAEGIRQTGLVTRKVAWNQVATVRMARWGATRLIVRRGGGPFFSVFHGGTPELKAAFERVVQSARN